MFADILHNIEYFWKIIKLNFFSYASINLTRKEFFYLILFARYLQKIVLPKLTFADILHIIGYFTKIPKLD